MALQFFSKFRQLASTLDRDCHQLSSDLENSEASAENENRSCLLLREILADTRNLKSETCEQFEQSRNKTQPFGEVLDVCRRVLEGTREQLHSLEDHLDKYGYKKPADPLTSIHDTQTNGAETETKDSTAMETDRDDTFIMSEKYERRVTSDGDEGKTSREDEFNGSQSDVAVQHSTVSKLAKQEETDSTTMGSPQRPITFTRMLQMPTESPQAPLSQSIHTPHAPIPPVTATPLMKERTVSHNSEDGMTHSDMTELWPGSPMQPVTATPLIKSGKKIPQPADGASPILYSPQIPCPPLLGTPGLKALSVNERKDHTMLESSGMVEYDMDELPEAPDITSVQILKPENFEIPPSFSLGHEDMISCSQFVVRPVSCEEYSTLPEYIKAQFSLQFINQLTEEISKFLSSNRQDSGESPSVTEKDLRDILHLGPRTKAYMLVLANIGRIRLNGDLMIFVS